MSLETAQETLSLQNAALRIAVVADSHSNPHPKTAQSVAAQRRDHILHAGDIGALSVLTDLGKIAPVHAVRGNIDGHGPEIPDVRVLDLVDEAGTLVRILLMHIAVNGPKLRADARRLAKAHDAGLVVCGHSHVPFLGRDGDLPMFNPGSIGPRRFQLPILFGMIHVSRSGIRLEHLECETGRPWAPPR